MSKLNQLSTMTTIVVDTSDIDAIKAFTPTDATTNPSLILAAAEQPQYQHLIDDAVEYGKKHASDSRTLRTLIMDKLFVNFGVEILKLVPGRVSTEVDAHLSFDVQGSIDKAHTLIKLYEEAGIDKQRILIKLASTWEGVQAAHFLEKEGIHCNMTLMFSLVQAVACADANATLISPFVGRILDWYKKNSDTTEYAPKDDPGVLSVTAIYNYYKKFDIKTQIMGASFRNSDEIIELAGCDLLTIAPKLLKELSESDGKVTRRLDSSQAATYNITRLNVDEAMFRWLLNDEAMAIEKLSEGIRRFAADYKKLEEHISQTYNLTSASA